MIKIFLFSLFVSHVFAAGKLVLIGGGKRAPEVLQEIMSLSSRNAGHILIVPLASEEPEAAVEGIKKELEQLGAGSVIAFSGREGALDTQESIAQVQGASFIYFTGGDQKKLAAAFKSTMILSLIKERFKNKEISLAGTSAGTAVMSEVMITGGVLAPYTTFDAVRPQMVETAEGFGFVKKFILDQHFLVRSRENRLMSATLENPQLIGVGIDEEAAIVLDEDESFRVIGKSQVMIMDARSARISVNTAGAFEVQGMLTHLLSPGQDFPLKNQ